MVWATCWARSGEHDEQFRARVHVNAHRRVEDEAAQFLAERAVARLAGRQDVLAALGAEAGGEAGDLGGLAGTLHALKVMNIRHSAIRSGYKYQTA